MTPKKKLEDMRRIAKFINFLLRLHCISWETWDEVDSKLDEDKFEILVSLEKFYKGEV